MEKPSRHILVCGGFRISGDAQGACAKKGSLESVQYIENELIDRGLADTIVSTTGCLKVCDRGPAMVIYPDNIWYGGIDTEEKVDEVLDALEDGEVLDGYVIA